MNLLKIIREKETKTGSVALVMFVAAIADVAQVPATVALLSGLFTVEAVVIDVLIDICMGIVATSLMGFHWLFLPIGVIEAIPGIDIAPTWTACVTYVAWSRREQMISNAE